MPRNESNILELVFSRDRDVKPSAAPRAEETSAASTQEMKAIASCLEYLYGESMRLGQRLPAHLIGAAAESLRQEMERQDADTGSGNAG